jgi:hypothetical protein
MEDTWDQYRLAATRALENKSFREAEGYWAMAALIGLQWGEGNNRYLYSLYQLSQTSLSGNNMPMAEMVTRRILALQSGTLKSDMLEQASMAYKLSEILFRSAKFSESLTLCRQILNVYESRLDQSDSRLSEIRGNIALLESKLAEMEAKRQPPATQMPAQQQFQPQQAQPPVQQPATQQAPQPVQQQAPQQAYAPAAQQNLQPAYAQAQQAPYAQTQSPQAQQQQEAYQASQRVQTHSSPRLRAHGAGDQTSGQAGAQESAQGAIGTRMRASELIKNYNQKKKYKVDNVCQLCGRQFQGGWCGKCTGTNIKAIGPQDNLKKQPD